MTWLAGLAFNFSTNVCDTGGPGDAGLITVDNTNYPTISAAIAAASDGDTIFVCRGDYPVSATISRSITLEAVDGPDHTRLDGFGLPGLGVLTLSAGQIFVEGFEIVAGDPFEPGILVEPGAEAQIWGDRIFGSADRGIMVSDGADAVLVDTEVFGNAGGILAIGKGVLGLSGSRVWGNFADVGAGLLIQSGRIVFGGTVENNTATFGGGVFAMDAALIGTTIVGNSADDGGNLFVGSGSDVALSGCAVKSGFASRGGGIFVGLSDEKSRTSLALESTDVAENVAESEGGGVWHGGSEVVGDGKSSVSWNYAPLGGGVFVDDRDFGLSPIQDLVISDNTAVDGGGVYISSVLVAPTGLIGDQILRNTAIRGGGVGMPALEKPQSGFPGSLVIDGGTAIEGNTAEVGGGIYAASREVLVSRSSIALSKAEVGGGICLEQGALVKLYEGVEVYSNAAGVGGGAAVLGLDAKLLSYGADWGFGASDNTPEDVSAGGAFSYSTETFGCSVAGCSP